mgnify:FL=1
MGFSVVATNGTQKLLEEAGVPSKRVFKISEGRPNIEDMLTNGEIDLVINTSDNQPSKEDSKKLRQSVIRNKVPYFTTIAAAQAVVEAVKAVKSKDEFTPKAIQDYLA